ncbi:hypothetical protein JXJ21_17455 [candidate division KSB1 bacterium]|nr:hypothetical protein [candidate division KSB1 bacterium]
MTPQRRFREALLFGNPDKIPLNPGGPRESTRAIWRTQGLPPDVDYYEYLMKLLNIDPELPDERVGPGISFKMIPTFEEKVIEHKNGHYIVQDWMGAITEISDDYDYTYIRSAKDFVTRKWHKFPVETREDWQEMKKRYDPKHPERFAPDFEERCRKLLNRNYVSDFQVNGPFWQLREWVGMENLCIMMLDDPQFVEDMVEFWIDFVSETMAPLLERVELDRVGISEDMAFKIHSMISPEMARHFLQPAYKRWVAEIKASNCPIVDMDSDGFVGELIPIWIESGINVCDPIEVAAGNDIVEFRQQFGRQMAYTGGIDKRALAKGGKVMRDEVLRVVPPLLIDGGFIPGCDHGVPPDISWQNFVEYSRLLAELCGWL